MASGSYDTVIVGAGSAGCVLANRLSADPARRVLLLEAGGPDRNFWLKLPVGYFRTIYDTRFSRLFPTEPSEGTAGRRILWPRGRIVGGSSSINGLIFIRGQQEDYDDWAAMGAEGWAFRDVLPSFRRIETFVDGENQLRGAHGEMPVSRLRNDNTACDAWVRAAREMGLPPNDDFNGETTYGVGSYQLTISKHWRASAAGAFLRPALSRQNLTLVTGAQVTRILFEGDRAVGVEWAEGRDRKIVHAGRIILAAGALQSPQLLLLSGIGPADHLKETGITPLVDLPGVGENLQDHYQARTIVRLKARNSLNDDVRNPLRLAQMGWDWLMHGRGPLTVGAGQVGGAACTEHAVAGRPDVQFNVMPLSVDKPGDPLHRYSGFTASLWQCHPQSHGRLRLRSTDPFADPIIEPRYLSAEIDRQTITAGLRMLREIYAAPAFRELWGKEVLPGQEAQDDAALLDFARQHGGTVFHQCGTCKMGTDAMAVVSPDLDVRGVRGLSVVDASIMPKITSANTNAAALMIGEHGARIILRSGV